MFCLHLSPPGKMAGIASSSFLIVLIMAIIILQTADLSVESKATQDVTMPGSNFSGASAKPPRLIPAQNGKSNDQSQGDSGRGCPNCKNSNSVDDVSQESAVHKLRIEMIKAKILAELQLDRAPVLKEKPKKSRIADLLLNWNLSEEGNDDNQAKDSEYESYGETSKIVVFSEKAKVPPPRSKHYPSAKLIFQFKLQRNSQSNSVPSALLWIHMRKSRGHELYGKFLHVQALSKETADKESMEMQDIKVITSKVKKEKKSGSGWIVVDVKDIVQHWFNKTASNFNATERPIHALEISCQDCETEISDLISSRGHLPFLEIDLEKPKALSRKKRQSIDCTSATKECCRESLYVNFTEIGWDWIIFPSGFPAGYCKGSCETPPFRTPVVSSQFFLRHLKVTLPSCCTPTKMSGVDFLLFDGDGILIRKTLNNVQVEECGC